MIPPSVIRLTRVVLTRGAGRCVQVRAALCICGLRIGVREHDHERIRQAISETALLGLSAKVGKWVGAAIDDLALATPVNDDGASKAKTGREGGRGNLRSQELAPASSCNRYFW